jgi:hypothetical protein
VVARFTTLQGEARLVVEMHRPRGRRRPAHLLARSTSHRGEGRVTSRQERALRILSGA